MAIKLSGSNIIDDNRNIVSAGVVTATRAVIGSGVTITSGGIHAVGLAITAASFSGDGSGLSNTGSTLSAASGSQRVVVTSQTSGTMTASSTDADLTFDANSNVLSVNGGLNVTGVATATSVRIGSAVTANSGGIRVAGVGTFTNVEGVNITSPYGGSLNLSNNHPSNGYKGGKVSAKKNVPWINDSIVPSPTIGGDAAIFNISIFDYQDTLTGQFFAIKDPAGDIDVFDAAAWCIQPSQTAWQNHQTWFRSSGNVGFGTTNPSSKVQVIGDVTATSFLTGASGSAIRVTSDTISGPATLNIDPAAVGDNTGTVVIKGDLQVDGTTTTVNSTTLTVDDKNIELGSTASPSDATADGGGITLKGTTDKTLNWVDATDSWTSSESVNLLTGKTYKIAGTDVLTASAVLGK
jgi:lipopolysaccharide export system protein LptA